MERDSGYDYIMNHPEETGKHIGKWMLIYDNKIVAADEDLLKIYKQFEKDYPNKIPFVMKFPKGQFIPTVMEFKKNIKRSVELIPKPTDLDKLS